MVLYDPLRRSVQIASAAVIAKARPEAQNFARLSGGKSQQSGKAVEKTAKVGNDGGHGRLLEHDFADPNAIRIARVTPGKIAGIFVEPAQQAATQMGTAAWLQKIHRGRLLYLSRIACAADWAVPT